MLKEIAKFEILYQLRQPLFYICLTIFFLLTFGAVTTDSVQIGGAIGNVNRNAPYVVMQILGVMSAIGIFTTTAFVAGAIHRDFEFGTAALFFSTPLKKRDYFAGRFAGSAVVAFFVFAGVVLALLIGGMMPWLDAERIGPVMAGPYLTSLLFLVLPNVIITGAIFFAIAALTRSMLATYASVAAIFVGYVVGQSLLADINNERLANLLDPFGLSALELSTRYWTVFEKNSASLPITGPLLWNRLLWLALSLAIFGFAYARFSFYEKKKKGGKKAALALAADEDAAAGGRLATVKASQDFSHSAMLQHYLGQTRVEFGGILRGVPFIVMFLIGMLNIVGNSFSIDALFGTPIHPVTNMMIRVIQGAFLLFGLLIMTFYSGELTFRERSLKLNEVYDALPVRTWVWWGSKLTALALALAVMFAGAIATSMIIQAFRGYTDFDLPLYLRAMFLEVGPNFLFITILALFFQVITNNKFVGFLGMVVYFISLFALPAMDFQHNLYRYASTPEAPYSDMNGYGHFVQPLIWFTLYWAFIASILGVIIHLFWVRGTEPNWRKRFAIARQRFTAGPKTALAMGLLGAIATGSFIYYNTNILNDYRTEDDVEEAFASYEKKYKRLASLPHPKIVDAEASVDIYPERRNVRIRGRYILENRTGGPLTTIYTGLNPLMKTNSVAIGGARVAESDRKLGVTTWQFSPPLAPGARTPMNFDIEIVNQGFVNGGSNNRVVYNGTFIDSAEFFPHLGYVEGFELEDATKRKKYGLAAVQRFPKINDPRGRQRTYISSEGDWITFRTTVSTSPDQIAIAPGYLKREWTENGRRYFRYEMDSPILPFWSYLSARYEVKKDRWNDVAIEIYYDRQHPYNVDKMIHGVKKSLDYFTENFGPYQHSQVRIVEFPRYARFAQSFPNTIPFSESIGFIANLKDPDDIDYVFYITAHEVAHQWWAHQVIGANVQGATMLSETMSQYSALMVMEKEYGRDKMQRFLKYELDRYLAGRGGELVEEMPLFLVENQPYIHYRKGSLIMYALRDYVGEEKLNKAIAEYVKAVKFQQPPYTTSVEFLSFIKPVAPPNVVRDLFEAITLYENRATAATVTKRGNQWVVKMTVEAKKFRSDGAGRETPVPLDDWIDVGVLAGKDVIAVEKRRITQPVSTIELVVNKEPTKAGIDPLNKLIDRNPDDNVTAVGGP